MPQLSQHDPLSVAATDAAIRTAWLEIMELPVAANDGKVFQFDLVSERLMENTLLADWVAVGITTMDWRLDDNTTVNVTKVQLQAYFDELKNNRTIRGFVVDGQYVNYKTNGATLRELATWKQGYIL